MSKRVDTPATNVKINPEAEKLNENEHGDYRRHVGRLIHISLDRVDIQYAVKQLTKDVQGPTVESWTALKRVFRYLMKAGPLTMKYNGKPTIDKLAVETDSRCAGEQHGRTPRAEESS